MIGGVRACIVPCAEHDYRIQPEHVCYVQWRRRLDMPAPDCAIVRISDRGKSVMPRPEPPYSQRLGDTDVEPAGNRLQRTVEVDDKSTLPCPFFSQ
jgi:hypothetical protein